MFRRHRRIASPDLSASPIRSKTSTPEAIAMLHEDGVRIVMLTGDNRTTAEAVAKSSASMKSRPTFCRSKRRAVVKRLQSEGRIVAMAGDGINDAPALAAGPCRHRDGHRHRRRDGKRRQSRWSKAICAASPRRAG